MPTLLPLSFPDGSTNALSIFEGAEPRSPVVVIFPALGVRAHFYRHYAVRLAAEGVHVVTSDHRGHGHSSVRASRSCDFGYREQVELEYVGILRALRVQFPDSAIFFMGHSIGSQMGVLVLARYPELLDGFIVNAGCSVYYKGWGRMGPGVLAFAHVVKWSSQLLGYYPGHILRFGGKEARGIMMDWFCTASTGAFKAANEPFDYDEAMRKVNLPVLGLTYEGDRSAPPEALAILLDKFPSAQISTEHIRKNDRQPCDHYTWVREPELSLGQVLEWVRQHARGRA